MPNYYKIRGKNGTLLLNRQTVRNMLYSKEIQGALQEVAGNIQERAGKDYAVEIFHGHDRSRAIIKPDSQAANEDNLKNNTLLKAVGK